VHPDKAFTAGRAAPVTPDLAGANTARYGLRGHLTETDFTERARLGAVGYLASGATVIRAHTDVFPVFGTIPVTGAAGRENVAALRDAIDAGADLAGGAASRSTAGGRPARGG